MSWYNPTTWGGKITPIHTKRGEGGRPASGEKPSDRIEQKPESKSLGKIVEEMRSDYQVSFCERILGANIAAIQVTASGETVSEELTESLQTLWDRTLSSMLDSIAYGRVAYELEWKNDGVYQVPCRAEPLPFELSRMNLCDGRFDGIEVKTKSGQWEPIDVMNSWWLAIDATVVQPHGRSRFLPAPYEVYKDKRGAKKNRQTATSKWGTRGPIMRGPQTDFDPQTQQTFDVLPELSPAVDVWSAGGMLYLSNDRDPASKDGNEYKYAVEQAELAGFDPTSINDTIERMDVEMARAFGIAEQTIMEAGGVGTYGSITQKMLLLFAVCEGILDQWCRSFEKYVIAKVLAVNGLPAESITLSYTSLAQRPDAFIFEAIKILLANPQFVEAIMAGGVDIKAMLEDAGFPVTEQLAAVMATIAQRMAATAAAGAPPIGAAPAGEMSGLGRRQWQNNRKAINDVLQDLIAGSTSEVMAKELLQSLGVPPERAQVFIDDAKDGKVDDAELTAADGSSGVKSMSDFFPLGYVTSVLADMIALCGGKGGTPGPCPEGSHAPTGIKEKSAPPAPTVRKPLTRKPAPPPPAPTPKTKSEIAKASAVRVDKHIQRYSEEHNEPMLAKALKGSSLKDNEPVDVLTTIGGKKHGIELKTMVSNTNNKLTMKRSAMELKAAWERKNKAPVHTVVFDDRKVFNAKGPGVHDYSQRKILYRRGYGSFRVDKMHEVVGGMKGLMNLLATAKRALPIGAK